MKLGILGAGSIARVMANTVRLLNQNGHPEIELYAVAARDAERARAFAEANGVQTSYGSYEAMLDDPAVDLVYIATPHSHHYPQMRLCLQAGKAVLCEKAFTVTARQAEDVLREAHERRILVTEAIWTRYQPMRARIRAAVESGEIGEPRVLTANLAYNNAAVPRIALPQLAGGALLDMGVYTLNFAEMVFGRPAQMQAVCTKNEHGVDMTDNITLTWADGRVAHLTTAATCMSDRMGVIYGTGGYLVVENINNPQSLRVYDADHRLLRQETCPPQLTGYEYELLEAAACLAGGKTECPSMPHAETIHIMQVMDCLRAQMGIRYPCEGLHRTDL